MYYRVLEVCFRNTGWDGPFITLLMESMEWHGFIVIQHYNKVKILYKAQTRE